jgi:hypothetical protein
MDLFTAAEQARNQALAVVAGNAGSWMTAAMAAAVQCRQSHPWPGGFVAEDLRAQLVKDGLPRPHHHNVWGAFTNQAIKEKLIRKTGQYRNMRGPRSHARSTPVYVWG